MFLTQCIKGGDQNKREGWLISFEYDQDFIETFKERILHISREWRPEQKVWWVSVEYADTLKQLFTNFEALAFLQKTLF